MNPHFIFNSLNSVQGLINRDDKQSASEYVRTISDLIRQNMYNISGDFISLEKELNLVANYLKLEKLRFKDQLNYEIIIDDCIEADLIMIPPLLVQPLVENALKYGILASDREDGFVSIDLYSEDTITCIDVTDYGDGLRLQHSNDTDHQSSALENIKRRLYHLFLLHHKKITLSVTEITELGVVTGVRSQVRIHN